MLESIATHLLWLSMTLMGLLIVALGAAGGRELSARSAGDRPGTVPRPTVVNGQGKGIAPS